MDQRLWETFLRDWNGLSAYQRPLERGLLLQEAARLLKQVRGTLLPLLEGEPNRTLEAAIRQAFQQWEERLQRLKKSSPEALDNQLFILEIQLALLQPLASVADGQPWDEHRHLLSALKALEYRLGPGLSPASYGIARLHRLRLRLIGAQLKAFARAYPAGPVGKPLSEIHALWPQVRHGEQLLLSFLHELLMLHGESPFLHLLEKSQRSPAELSQEVRPAVQQLSELARRLDGQVDRLIQAIRRLPRNQFRRWVGRYYREMGDFAAELASQDDDRFPLLETFASQRAYRHLQRFQAVIANDSERRQLLDFRGLRRLTKRFRADWVERTLSLRLHHRFGPQFEHRLDLGVLAAVLLAILLLGIEVSLSLTEEQLFQILVADTAICVFLLSDFLLRLYFSPDRGDYFRRHWLTDLLPAIPFGAIGHGLQSLILEAETLYALRLVRVLTIFLRKARPLIKLVRIVLFAARGMDRLVRRYRRLLDWNILFFEPQPQEEVGLEEDWHRLHRRLEAVRHTHLAAWDRFHVQQRFHRQLAWLSIRAADAQLQEAPIFHRRPPAIRNRCIPVESLSKRLLRAEGDQLLELLGERFPQHINRLLWLIWLPPLRWLPPFSDLLAARREAGQNDLAFTLAAARRIGARLYRLNQLAHFFADMQGVITPAQLLDRIGAALIESMRRPRNRLLILGSGFMLVSLLVELIHARWLEVAAAWLRQTLGWPILLLGVFALIAVWLGTRLRALAQTNAEFFTRIARAKSLGLLGEIKRDRALFDQQMLLQRVLAPEARIRGLPEEAIRLDQGATENLAGFSRLVRQVFHLKEEDSGLGSLAERVYLLYQDYLHDVPFHDCNTGSLALLLGDPAVHNLRTQFLGPRAAGDQELQQLDPKQAGGFLGPSLWPRFITLAITQYTGQLVEEYNRHALPLWARTAPPRTPEEIERFHRWLDRRQGKPVQGDECQEPPDRAARYATTVFTSLDFLSNDPARSAAIRQQFGEEIAELVALDRRRLIHRIFGVPPHHLREIPRRSLNPYALYQQLLANGRVFWLPFSLLGSLMGLVKWGLRWLWHTFQDLRRPQIRCIPAEETVYSDYRIARRKILRMHKPVLLASIRLRAQVDPEYLGLLLPESEGLQPMDQALHQDLRRIQASPEERKAFQQLREQQQTALEELGELWDALAAPGGFISQRLQTLYPDFPDHRRREALRACSLLYLANCEELRRLFQLPKLLKQCVREAIAQRGQVPQKKSRFEPLWILPQVWRRYRYHRADFQRWWERQGQHFLPKAVDGRKARAWVMRWWLWDAGALAQLVELAVKNDFAPRAAALALLDRHLRNLSVLTEQLVTLRTVQTLGILELEASLHIVRGLGEYPDEAGNPPPRVRIPTL